MSDRDQQNVKRRLAGEGRAPPEIGRMTPEIALKLALARACEDAMGLEVMAKSVKMQRLVLGSFIDELPENALIALLQDPRNRLGLAVFDDQMLAGVIEKQTTGRVVPTPAAARMPTRTDAVMCADLLNDMLAAFQAEGEEAGMQLTPVWSGFEYALPLEDPRAIQMAMEDIPYRLFEVQLDLEKGAKEGRILLLYPYDPPRARSAKTSAEADDENGALAEVVQETETQMDAVLHRVEMPLSQITTLAVGSLVPIPSETIMEIQLEDILGEKISIGSLGVKSGHRAVRINLNGSSDAQTMTMSVPRAAVEGGADMPPLVPDMAGMAPPLTIEGATTGETVEGLPDLPDLPPIDGIGEMGELPPLEGIGDLPDLADLGALGSMD